MTPQSTKPDARALRLLGGLAAAAAAAFLLSLSVGQAANHVHEYGIKELSDLIEACGLRTVKRYGTFASYHPLKKALTPEHLAVYEQLREFHGDDLMACFLSPLYPDAARNNFRILERA